jgi:hypothetical protein
MAGAEAAFSRSYSICIAAEAVAASATAAVRQKAKVAAVERRAKRALEGGQEQRV